MWDRVHSYDWSPGEFRALFEQLYTESADLETLWYLGGAVNDYLRRYPGDFNVPPELPRKLLVSANVDARIIGLKLLNRADVDVSEIGRSIIAALHAPAEYGEYSGLYETGNFISRCRERKIRLPSALTYDLIAALRQYVADKDDNDQRCASHHIEELEDISA
jgi:hypothetical protein